MEKSFKQFKQKQVLEESYKQAQKLQENFALTCMVPYAAEKPYEAHISVLDVINKIDSMTKLFEEYMRNKTVQQSGPQLVAIIENLYVLASNKLEESKNKTLKYMQKIAVVDNQEPVDQNQSYNQPSSYSRNNNGSNTSSSAPADYKPQAPTNPVSLPKYSQSSASFSQSPDKSDTSLKPNDKQDNL